MQQKEELEQKNEELLVLQKKEQEMMEKEREYMKENISSKERQIATVTMLSHEKNALLNQLLAQVRKVKDKVETEVLTDLKDAEKLIQKNLDMQDSWDTFVFQFENVHPDFFRTIKGLHPDITPTELKMSTYLKIGFSNKEIAQVANITLATIKKNINRLKKRLQLEPEDDVRAYIWDL